MLTVIQSFVPSKGISCRLLNYLNEMYPVLPRMITAILLFVSFTLFLGEIHGQTNNLFSVYSLVGSWSLFVLALILRFMDELKDKELDAELFKNRPLPTGRVLENDIKFGLIVSVALYLLSHLFSMHLLISSFVVLVYTLLMFKYFFAPKKFHSNLILNLLTHNPIVLLFLVHLTAIFLVQHKLASSSLNFTSLLCVSIMFWFLFLSWEIARKIRYGNEETEYITYSKIFGTYKAGLIAFMIQTISFGIAVYFYMTLTLSFIFLATILLAYAILLKSYFSFFTNRISHGLQLRTSAEQYATLFMSAIIIEQFTRMV